MGCETNLPEDVRLYLEVISELFKLCADMDSNSPEAKMVHFEISDYFRKISRAIDPQPQESGEE